MSKEIKFRYFLNGVETKNEEIDWNRASSIIPKGFNKDEIHVKYMDEVAPNCGMSTRHKMCNSDYKHPLDINIDRGVDKPMPRIDYDAINKEFGYNMLLEDEYKVLGFLEEKVIGDNEIKGVKYNSSKPQISLLFRQFPKALEAITRCSEYGNEKYKEFDHDFKNYQRVEGGSKNYADSGLRHRLQEGNDDESGLPHYYHVAWNALAELELLIKEKTVNKTKTINK